MENAVRKTCLHCSQPLKGRCDKKFCDDYCRNNYNNRNKAGKNLPPLVKYIMRALMKNREILEDMLAGSENVILVKREELLMRGFEFRYMTHQFVSNAEAPWKYCFEYGWRVEGEDEVVVGRR